MQLAAQPGWNGTSQVFVHTPSGALVSQAQITSSLAVDIDDGDEVTIVLVGGGLTQVFSNVGIERGDVIEVSAEPVGTLVATTVAVDMPSVPGATMWEVGTSYDTNAGAVASSVTTNVPPGTTAMPIIATAYDDTGALAMFAETSAPITGGQAPAVTLHDQIGFRSITVDTTGLPTGATQADVSPYGVVFLGDAALELTQLGTDSIVPIGFGDYISIAATAFGTAETVTAGQVGAGMPTDTVSIDLSAPDLPQISALALSPSQASWTLAGGASYDYISVDLWASSNTSYTYTVMAPAGTSALPFMQLPAELAPPPFDSFSVAATEISNVEGYADALRDPDALFRGGSFEVRSASVPVTDVVRR
ncbi:MAG TPA: hypothetical protein VMJ10_22910 [Kofleriaceae bacterium]|nr:hypothetical protein [Kofleriaceae bacterium]